MNDDEQEPRGERVGASTFRRAFNEEESVSQRKLQFMRNI